MNQNQLQQPLEGHAPDAPRVDGACGAGPGAVAGESRQAATAFNGNGCGASSSLSLFVGAGSRWRHSCVEHSGSLLPSLRSRCGLGGSELELE